MRDQYHFDSLFLKARIGLNHVCHTRVCVSVTHSIVTGTLVILIEK